MLAAPAIGLALLLVGLLLQGSGVQVTAREADHSSVVQATDPQIGDVEVYLPLMFKDKFYGYTYSDNFADWGSGWPGGNLFARNSDGSVSDEFTYGYKYDSNLGSKYPPVVGTDGMVFHINIQDDQDHVFVTGPSTAYVLQNFYYEASARRVSDQLAGDEYGILLSPVPLDPKNPNSQGQIVYTIQVRLTSPWTGHWVFAGWKISNTHDHEVVVKQEGDTMNYLAGDRYWWNRLRFSRDGNTLRVWMCNEGTWGKWYEWMPVTRNMADDFPGGVPDKFYIGFFAATSGPYRHSFEAQFDEVLAVSTPR
ncbi:MAG: hypothetical protein JW934_24145 [Anaerolineae bacterium]|nr:hypothetical protein [Anaerolineae bacterium]